MKIKKILFVSAVFFFAGGLLSVAKDAVIVTKANQSGRSIKVHIEAGAHWDHMFEAGKVSIKTTPQIAVWIEDLDGNYLDTLYVTKKTATQRWRGKPGPYEEKGNIRRKTSLPYWSHKRGVRYEDGLYLPTKKEPLPDSVTSASPKGSFRLNSSVGEELKTFILLVEINNSTDFNEYYTREAKPDDPFFSGGSYGSGQPAVVYHAVVDMDAAEKTYALKLAGHSSPDGENGQLYTDFTKLTTAKQIADKIMVVIN